MAEHVQYKNRMDIMDIHLLTHYMKFIKGSRLLNINACKAKNRYVFKFFNHPRNINLILNIGSSLYTTDKPFDTQNLTDNFIQRLRKTISGLHVINVGMIRNNKIIKISLHRKLTGESEKDYDLYMEFYSTGNLILTHRDDLQIIDLWRKFKLLDSSFTKGSSYPLPMLIEKYSKNSNKAYKILSEDILKRCETEKLEKILDEYTHNKYKQKYYIRSVANELVSYGCFLNLNRESSFEDTGMENVQGFKFNAEEQTYENIDEKYILFDDYNNVMSEYYSHLDSKIIEQRLSKVDKDINKKNDNLVKKINVKILEHQNKIEMLNEDVQCFEENFSSVNSLVKELIKHGRSDFLKMIEDRNSKGELNMEIKVEQLNENHYFFKICFNTASKRYFAIEVLNGTYDLNRTLNAVYDGRKKLVNKLKSIEEHKGRLFELTNKKLGKIRNEKIGKISLQKNSKRKRFWFEKYKWFITSNNKLVLIGKDSGQNISLLNKYFTENDLFFHSNTHGAPFVIGKCLNKDKDDQSQIQAAISSIIYSTSWKRGVLSNEAYSIKKDQVRKTAKSGEYLQKGSVSIRGEKTFYKLNVNDEDKLEFGCGLLFIKEGAKEGSFKNINYMKKLENNDEEYEQKRRQSSASKNTALLDQKNLNKKENGKQNDQKIDSKDFLQQLNNLRQSNTISKEKKGWEITEDMDDQIFEMALLGFKPKKMEKKKKDPTKHAYQSTETKSTKRTYHRNAEEESKFQQKNIEFLEFDYSTILDRFHHENTRYSGVLLMTGPASSFSGFEYKVRLIKGKDRRNESFKKIKSLFLKEAKSDSVKDLIHKLNPNDEISCLVDNVTVRIIA